MSVRALLPRWCLHSWCVVFQGMCTCLRRVGQQLIELLDVRRFFVLEALDQALHAVAQAGELAPSCTLVVSTSRLGLEELLVPVFEPGEQFFVAGRSGG